MDAPTPATTMTDLNELFEMLARPRRRHVLYVLRRRERPMSVEELTERVHRLNHGSPPDASAGPSIHVLHDALVNDHLPALARAGLVHYDPETVIAELDRDDVGLRLLLDLAWDFEIENE